jgi:hypothetical protein
LGGFVCHGRAISAHSWACGGWVVELRWRRREMGRQMAVRYGHRRGWGEGSETDAERSKRGWVVRRSRVESDRTGGRGAFESR